MQVLYGIFAYTDAFTVLLAAAAGHLQQQESSGMCGCYVEGPEQSLGNMSQPPFSPADTTALCQFWHRRGSSVEGMCFPQCQALTLHTALCSFPSECKLWHTMKELEMSQRSTCTRMGILGLLASPWNIVAGG